MNENKTPEDNKFLVVGYEDKTQKQALVGVATDLFHASNLVGLDYLDIMSSQKLNPVEYKLMQGVKPGEPNYRMNGYSWTFVPVQFNSLLNFAL